MPKYSVPHRIWRVVYPLLIFLALSVVVTMIAGIVYAVRMGMQVAADGGAMTDLADIVEELTEQMFSNALTLQLISNLLGLCIFIPMWMKTRKAIPRYSGAGVNAAKILATVFAGLSCSLLISTIITIPDLTKYFPSYDIVQAVLTGGNIYLQILAVVIIAPIVEELLCRGVILNRLLPDMPAWAAVVIQGALFGIMHMNLLQGLYAFVIGCALALLYIRTRNMWLTIIAHIAFNSTGYLLNGILTAMGVEDVNMWACLAVSAVILALCVWIFTKQPAPVMEIQEPEEEGPEVAPDAI